MFRRLATAGLIALTAFVLNACGSQTNESNPEALQEALDSLEAVNGSSAEPTGAEDLTLEKYDQLEQGMSLEQVEDILGPGTLDNSMDMEDFAAAGQTIAISTYLWQSPDASRFISVTFDRDQLQMKTQFGLD